MSTKNWYEGWMWRISMTDLYLGMDLKDTENWFWYKGLARNFRQSVKCLGEYNSMEEYLCTSTFILTWTNFVEVDFHILVTLKKEEGERFSLIEKRFSLIEKRFIHLLKPCKKWYAHKLRTSTFDSPALRLPAHS